jgi:hypothetical protein
MILWRCRFQVGARSRRDGSEQENKEGRGEVCEGIRSGGVTCVECGGGKRCPVPRCEKQCQRQRQFVHSSRQWFGWGPTSWVQVNVTSGRGDVQCKVGG